MDPATRYIHDANKESGYGKWGWIVYRCTYSDDEGWNNFKQMIIREMHNGITKPNTPDLNRPLTDSLEMIFF